MDEKGDSSKIELNFYNIFNILMFTLQFFNNIFVKSSKKMMPVMRSYI